jgi:hypothetical protein
MYHGVPVYGASQLVSQQDLATVIAVVQKAAPHPPEEVHALRVVGRDEVWLYPWKNNSHWIVNRSAGRWHTEGGEWEIDL